MPESPYYLAAKGRDDQVINVLVKLRGKNKNSVKAEADHIQVYIFYIIYFQSRKHMT